jgi:hypothetical protein
MLDSLDCLRGTGACVKLDGLMKGNGSSSGLCMPFTGFDEGEWEQVLSTGLAGSIGLRQIKLNWRIFFGPIGP